MPTSQIAFYSPKDKKEPLCNSVQCEVLECALFIIVLHHLPAEGTAIADGTGDVPALLDAIAITADFQHFLHDLLREVKVGVLPISCHYLEIFKMNDIEQENLADNDVPTGMIV